MLREFFDGDGLEGAGTHVQRDIGECNTAVLQAVKQRLIEMQARRRCGDRAGMPRVHRLIALGVGGLGIPCDVRRQRDVAVTIEIGFERNVGIEPHAKKPAVALEDRGLATALEEHAVARPGRVARGELQPRLGGSDDPLEQQLDLAAASLAAVQPRADDPGVVEDQKIAGREQGWQIREHAVVELRLCDMQETACRTRCRGHLRDELGRKGVVEIGQVIRRVVGHRAYRLERRVCPAWPFPR